jgi:hypothetical protein
MTTSNEQQHDDDHDHHRDHHGVHHHDGHHHQHHGSVSVDPPVTFESGRVITAHITLSEESWMVLTADEVVDMFVPDTLANRIRTRLIWNVCIEAEFRCSSDVDEDTADYPLTAEAGSVEDDMNDDVPF